MSRLPNELGKKVWILDDLIAKGFVTLFIGLWKSGKTTLESILLHAMGETDAGQPKQLMGRQLLPGRALVISEESSLAWLERRDYHQLRDHILILTREMVPLVDGQSWPGFCRYLASQVKKHELSLVIIDTLSSFWPVKDENANAEVIQALKPLKAITNAGSAVLIVHHPAKRDGGVGKSGRGAGALQGDADIIVEMRRELESDLSDRRRKIDYSGRFGTGSFAIELSEDGRSYELLGSSKEVRASDRTDTIRDILPDRPPGLTAEEVQQQWPLARKPALRTIRSDLANGEMNEDWICDGEGIRGSPKRYWIIAAA